MIKPSELRIGNYYESTKWGTIVKCEASDIVQIYHNADGAEVDSDHIAMVFKPIYINKERLFTINGFSESKFIEDAGEMVVNKILRFVVYEHMGTWNLYTPYWVNGVTLHAIIDVKLHQLQNLYFILTGEEITIK